MISLRTSRPAVSASGREKGTDVQTVAEVGDSRNDSRSMHRRALLRFRQVLEAGGPVAVTLHSLRLRSPFTQKPGQVLIPPLPVPSQG